MSVISIILVLIIAFLAGLDGILDQFQFHQPLVSCTLIGLASGHTVAGIMLGGTLQFLALGWANIGAAVAPDGVPGDGRDGTRVAGGGDVCPSPDSPVAQPRYGMEGHGPERPCRACGRLAKSKLRSKFERKFKI